MGPAPSSLLLETPRSQPSVQPLPLRTLLQVYISPVFLPRDQPRYFITPKRTCYDYETRPTQTTFRVDPISPYAHLAGPSCADVTSLFPPSEASPPPAPELPQESSPPSPTPPFIALTPTPAGIASSLRQRVPCSSPPDSNHHHHAGRVEPLPALSRAHPRQARQDHRPHPDGG